MPVCIDNTQFPIHSKLLKAAFAPNFTCLFETYNAMSDVLKQYHIINIICKFHKFSSFFSNFQQKHFHELILEAKHCKYCQKSVNSLL